jgi:hypothetical protein
MLLQFSLPKKSKICRISCTSAQNNTFKHLYSGSTVEVKSAPPAKRSKFFKFLDKETTVAGPNFNRFLSKVTL